MKKFVLLIITLLLLGACNQNTQQESTEEPTTKDSTETSIENDSTNDQENNEETTPTQGQGPSEIYTQLESKIVDRLDVLFAPEIDYRKSEYDFGVLNTITRNYSNLVHVIDQGEKFNSYYEWYSPKELSDALIKYHGFTIDFEKYSHANEEYAQIIYDGDYVYLVSADYPGFNGVYEPVINSIEQLEELPMYYVELQYKSFSLGEYEEAGHEGEFTLWDTPMSEWPDDMDEFITLNETKNYALFIEQGDTFALAYYGTTPLSEDERFEYIEGLNY